MPEVNGIDFCRELRNLTDYRKTPIIMLTAMSERDYIDRAFASCRFAGEHTRATQAEYEAKNAFIAEDS